MDVTVNDYLDLHDAETARLFANGGVDEIQVYFDDEGDSDPVDCSALINLLRQSHKKIEEVALGGRFAASPGNLTLVLLLFQRAKKLCLIDFGGVPQLACLSSCLLRHDGPKRLYFDYDDIDLVISLTDHETKLLFEGIALSPSLKELNICYEFESEEEAGIALVNALERNQTIERLRLEVSFSMNGGGIVHHQMLFQTAVLKTKVEFLQFSTSRGENTIDLEIPFNAISSTLCREDCPLKTLCLCGVEPPGRDETEATMGDLPGRYNKSVASYTITRTSLDCYRIMEVVGMFRSLVDLDLKWNKISDLCPLDPLLIGENVTLQRLNLEGNLIYQSDLRNFLQKLPKMKRLRYLSLKNNPFEEELTAEGFFKSEDMVIQAVLQNKSLEAICVFNPLNTFANREKYNVFRAKISVPLSLNRGGRRELESPGALPASLWPLVLERASAISYCHKEGHRYFYGEPTQSTRVDVVYWLLKEKMVGCVDALL